MIFTRASREHWPQFNLILFRFLFSYFSIYILFLFISGFIGGPLHWFSENILHWGEGFEIKSTGSGDTTHAWVTLAFNTFLALIIGTLWNLIDRKRISYNQLFYWFLVVVRLLLFLMMFTYGFAKVIKTQFPDASLTKLLQPIGEMSPMGLAWTFMGYSIGYNIFTGLSEIIGGLLVLFRKTVTLGALIIIGVMINVAMMNFMFDIPVKIFSIHLILLATILVFTDIRRVVNIFVLNKNAEAISGYEASDDKTYKKAVFWMKILLIALITTIFVFQGTSVVSTRKSSHIAKPLYGIWEAKEFIKNQDTIPPLITDNTRWHYLILDYKTRANVRLMDQILYYKLKSDTTKKLIQLYKEDQDSIPYDFNYTVVNPFTMTLKGVMETDTLEILFIRKDEQDFELINRGFNWVNEYPRNK